MHVKVKHRFQGAIFGRPFPPSSYSRWPPSFVFKSVFVGDNDKHGCWHQTELGFQSGSASSLSSYVFLSKWPELCEPQFTHDFMRISVLYKAFFICTVAFMHVMR